MAMATGKAFVKPLAVFQELHDVAPLVHVEAELARTLDLHPVVREIAAARGGILAHGHATGDERAAIARSMNRYGQLSLCLYWRR